jgi:tRNA 2-selenouridine synthase
MNCPVLDNAERARVGTAYKQVSSFVARKMGAALVARNIAAHLEHRFASRDPGWKPLVYCWRGGKRSEAMAHILREVGWKAMTLQGGYQQYRRDLLVAMETLPGRLHYKVVCGPTGSGKSRLLRAIAAHGGQVLDLESLASHRGSLLGDIPGDPQPSQKMFESLLWNALRGFTPAEPVFVEAESARIGALRVPPPLLASMRMGSAIILEVAVAERTRFLLQEYRHLLDDAGWLRHKLLRLAALHSRDTVNAWLGRIDAGDWPALVEDLLASHYDPAYRRSIAAHYPAASQVVRLDDLAPSSLDRIALALAGTGQRTTEVAAAR